MRRVSEGIYRDRYGYRVKVGAGGLRRERRYPKHAKLSTMQAWRDEQRPSLRQAAQTATRGTFAADVEAYLDAVQELPTFKERKHLMSLWTAVFGERVRESITSLDISTQLSAWLAEGLAASTVAHRRSALMNMWTVLDGTDAKNPVRATPKPEEPDPERRDLSYTVIEKILQAMPDVSRAEAGKARPVGSKTAARLRVIAYTGLPQASLKRLQPRDIDFDAGTVTLRPRRKGKGSKTLVVPLLPQGLDALRQFATLDCWGPFSTSAMYHSFQRACKALGLTGLRPYDLRHSFGTLVYSIGGDIRAAQLLLGHKSAATTQRYTQGAEVARLRLVTAAVGEALPKKRVGVSGGSRKRQGQKRQKTA